MIQSWIKVYPIKRELEKFQSENLNIEIFSETLYLRGHATTIVAELGDAACSWYGVCTQKEWISSLRSGRKILWLDARDLLPLACTVRQFNKLPPVCHPFCSSSQIHSRGTTFPGMLKKEKNIVDACSRERRFFLNHDLFHFSFLLWNKYIYIHISFLSLIGTIVVSIFKTF